VARAKTDPGSAASDVIGAEVSGGTLAVELIRSATEPVLAVHGISSQRKLWNWLRLTEDATDMFFGPSKWQRIGVPARFLTAEALS